MNTLARLFVYNYGHLFMYWDWALGTYRDPRSLAGKQFSKVHLNQLVDSFAHIVGFSKCRKSCVGLHISRSVPSVPIRRPFTNQAVREKRCDITSGL